MKVAAEVFNYLQLRSMVDEGLVRGHPVMNVCVPHKGLRDFASEDPAPEALFLAAVSAAAVAAIDADTKSLGFGLEGCVAVVQTDGELGGHCKWIYRWGCSR